MGFDREILVSSAEIVIESRLERLAGTARELSRTGEPMEPGMHNILLHPNVVESYVLGTLLGNLDGATVVNGEGFFRKEQFGSEQPVLRDDLHLRLDPLQPMKSGSYRFTMEGVPAARYAFISNGCLTHPVLNLKYARRFGAARPLFRPAWIPCLWKARNFCPKRTAMPPAATER